MKNPKVTMKYDKGESGRFSLLFKFSDIGEIIEYTYSNIFLGSERQINMIKIGINGDEITLGTDCEGIEPETLENLLVKSNNGYYFFPLGNNNCIKGDNGIERIPIHKNYQGPRANCLENIEGIPVSFVKAEDTGLSVIKKKIIFCPLLIEYLKRKFYS